MTDYQTTTGGNTTNVTVPGKASYLAPRRKKKGGGGGGGRKKKGGGGGGGGYDVTAPLTGRGLKREIKANTRLEFGPLTRQLKAEHRAQSDRETRIVPDYYNQYQADLARIRGDVSNAYASADQRMLAHTQAAGAQDAANRNALQERIAQAAALRGGTSAPAEGVDVGAANAEAARANQRTSMAGTLATQGANQFAYLSNRIPIATQQGIEQQQREALKRRSIEADQRELAARKGAYKTKLRGELRESERKYLLENKALGVDIKKAQISAKTSRQNSKRSSATSIANSKRTQKGQDRRQEDDQAFDKKEAKKDRRADKKKK